MEENKLTNESSEQNEKNPSGATDTPSNESGSQEQEPNANIHNEENGATLTQEQVNKIVQERLKRQESSFYEKYKVKDSEELINKLKLADDYESLQEKFSQESLKVSQLNKELAFVKNSIDPSREDDILTYFKGKNIEFSAEELVKAIETHPEWVKKTTTISSIGAEHEKKDFKETDDERMKRIFGV